MIQFGDVLPFLEENTDLAPTTRLKLLDILRNSQRCTKLQLELAVVIDCGEPFVKSTYLLEGDGALVFCCYDILSSLSFGIQTEHYPNLVAVANKLGDRTRTQQLIQYAKSCVQPGLEYLSRMFEEDLAGSVAAFKSARYFVPQKIVELKPDSNAINDLMSFPFLNDPTTLVDLKRELPDYLAKAADVSQEVTTVEWWKRHQNDLPKWASAAQKVALVQPSSAAVERAFSLLQNSFTNRQDHSLQDYVEASLMLQYNKH